MPPIAPNFSMNQISELEAARGFLRSAGLQAVVNPLYECGETIELVRPSNPHLVLWLLNATAGANILVTDPTSGAMRAEDNLVAAAKMVAAIESGEETVCA